MAVDVSTERGCRSRFGNLRSATGDPLRRENVFYVASPEELEQCLRGATPSDAVLFVQESTRTGHIGQAIAISGAARRLGLGSEALDLSEAAARAVQGDVQGAKGLVDDVLARVPAHALALHIQARLFVELGDPARAKASLGRLIDVFPDYPGAHGMLAALAFPGPPYKDVLARVHRLLRPQTYLEIGVEFGATLALATTATIAAGVDPAPLAPEKCPKGARFYRMTSDEFFVRETVDTVFDGKPVDIAFIDGMHWFEYALRDFANVERWAAPGSTIVLHDCLAVTPLAARRERASTFWVGDVWKVLEVLLELRPDLHISIVPTRPSGLVIVRRLDPTSRVLADNLREIVQHRLDAPYPYALATWPERYPFVTNDDAGLARALGPS